MVVMVIKPFAAAGSGGAEPPLPAPVGAALADGVSRRRQQQDAVAEAVAAMKSPMRLGRTPQWCDAEELLMWSWRCYAFAQHQSGTT